MNRIIKISHPIDIFILAHREAFKNALAKGFSLLSTGNISGYEEEEKQRIYHEGAINSLESIKEFNKKGV